MVHHPHNDTLVVIVMTGVLNLHMVLIDNGSSVNILAYTTFQKMGLLDKDMAATNNELYGYTEKFVRILGKINIPTHSLLFIIHKYLQLLIVYYSLT